MVKYIKAIRHPHIILLEIPRFCASIFILFNIIAVYFYGGGNYIDKSATGYSFSKNFFSDLGRSVSFSGESNLISFSCLTVVLFCQDLYSFYSFLNFIYFFAVMLSIDI